MKKVFMLLMIAGSTAMFASCGSNTESAETTTTAPEVQTEEPAPALEVESTSDTAATAPSDTTSAQ